MHRPPPSSTLLPYTTLFRSGGLEAFVQYLDRSKTALHQPMIVAMGEKDGITTEVAMEWNDSYHETMLCFTNNIPQKDRKSTRLNSSHPSISYAVFCLKKKNK